MNLLDQLICEMIDIIIKIIDDLIILIKEKCLMNQLIGQIDILIEIIDELINLEVLTKSEP